MTKSKSVTRTKIKVIETEKILNGLHYKGHHLQVCFNPAFNAFRVSLVQDDTNKPYLDQVEALCPYNMSKTAAEHFIRYLYWYQTYLVRIDLYREYIIRYEEDNND